MSGASLRVGFIGCGRMATAIAQGLVQSGFLASEQILGSDPSDGTRRQFGAAIGAKTLNTNPQLVAETDVIFLAVKPQHVAAVLREIAPSLTQRHLVVSVAAGVSIDTMTESVGGATRLVRVMPNTPCLVSAGASAFARGAAATPADAELVTRLLSTIGLAIEVPEPLLDAVTGLSGSGPAYVFQFIEALSDGGVRSGLPRDVSTRLAAQTVLGAAKMVLETKEHPGALKDAVTSPGGTTIAGLHELEKGAFRGTVISAVDAATRRARELGQAAAGK